MNEAPKGTVSIEEIVGYLDRDRFMPKREAAHYLGLALRNLEYRLVEIPHFRVGAKVLFRKSELDRWMEKHRENPAELDLDRLAEEAAREVLTGAKK